MEFPLVSLGRYKDMRERALRAEELVTTLIFRLEKIADGGLDRAHGIPAGMRLERAIEERALRADVETVRPDADGFLPSYDLPPEVEEAIKMRAPRGTPLFEELTDDARQAIELMGGDFDPDAYAEVIRRGTRVTGWPM